MEEYLAPELLITILQQKDTPSNSALIDREEVED